jgi:hypothetical protein
VITLYHRTQPERADAILREGFKDVTGSYGTANEYTGVWFSDVPLDAGDIGYVGPTNLTKRNPSERRSFCACSFCRPGRSR